LFDSILHCHVYNITGSSSRCHYTDFSRYLSGLRKNFFGMRGVSSFLNFKPKFPLFPKIEIFFKRSCSRYLSGMVRRYIASFMDGYKRTRGCRINL
jgi:hypothetical protein